MGEARAARLLCSLERAACLTAAALLAGLPAVLGYRMACWRGDWLSRHQTANGAELERNLRLVLGNEVSPAAAQQGERGWFRVTCREGGGGRGRWPGAREPSCAPRTSVPASAGSRCCTPAASRSPPSGAGGTTTT